MPVKKHFLAVMVLLINAPVFAQVNTNRSKISEVRNNIVSTRNNTQLLSENFLSVNLQMPGETTPSPYYVKETQDYYILNGDILISKNPGFQNKSIIKRMMKSPGDCKTCSATRDQAWYEFHNWQWDNGDIPVEIDNSVYATNSCSVVKDALEYMNANTCLNFYPRKSENDFVSIAVVPPDGKQGGNSQVGKQGGKQVIVLSNGKFNMYTLCHELMHAAGVWHEQCRKDRDNFISINWDNITDDMKHNFQIEDHSTAHGAFDFCSIMQYSAYISGMTIDNSKPAITCKYGCPACMGKQTNLTDLDIKGLSLYYGQIGLSRFPMARAFDMGCKGSYLTSNAALNAINQLNKTMYKLTGGITYVGNTPNKPLSYEPGNKFDGDGYTLEGNWQNTFYHYSLKSGIATAQGAEIGSFYRSLNLGNGILGWPENNETSYLGGAYQTFNHGYIYKTAAGGTFYVLKGPVYDKWANAGGIGGQLGWPEMSETVLPDGKGHFERFNHGHIYWSPAHGAYVVKGKIFNEWANKGWEKGPLGYPLSDYVPESRVSGTTAASNLPHSTNGYQKFEGGVIFYSQTAGGVAGLNETCTTELGNPDKILASHINPQSSLTANYNNMVQQKDSTTNQVNKIKNMPPRATQKTSVTNKKSNGAINPQPLPPKVQSHN